MMRSNSLLLSCSVGMALLSSSCRAAPSIRGPPRANLIDEYYERRHAQDMADVQQEGSSSSSPHRTLIPKSNRIIGGRTAPDRRYRYIVSLQSDGTHFCGGVLVAIDAVLTAAHCTNRFSNSQTPITVVIGRHDLSSDVGEELKVKEELVHPNYLQSVEYDNDFALLFLNTATMSKVELATLNHGNSKPRGFQSVKVLGWGDTVSGYGSVLLNEASLRIIPNNQCNNVEGDWNGMHVSYEGFIAESMLCAAFKNRDACQGDSGGPLIVEGSGSNGEDDLLVGLVSWGLGCANDFPGVYSRVSSGYIWIQREVCMRSVLPPEKSNCEPF